MPHTVPPRGVRKVSELITQNKRSLILSEEDASKLNWADIPVSTLKINSKTGIMSVKLEGESDWVPAGIKNDGTLVIAKDGKVNVENYIIREVDHSRKTFSYALESGDVRHSIIDDRYGFVFNLETGSYQIDRNQIEVIIDDILIRSKTSGGLFEISENKIGIKDTLVKDQEITIKYNCALRIGNPYPRFFLNSNEPDAKLAEIGDFWLDYDATMEQELGLSDTEPNPDEAFRRVNWDDINGRPNTVYGYGITDKISYEGHVHRKVDITDFPSSMKANGGNADTVNGLTADVNKPNTLAILDGEGKISPSAIPGLRTSQIIDFPSALPANGGNADTVQGLMPNNNNPDTLAIVQGNGKLPASILPKRTRADIIDFPSSLPANGGNADTVKGFTVDANRPRTLAIVGDDGKIPASILPRRSWADITNRPASFPARGGNADTVRGYYPANNAPNTLAIVQSDGHLPEHVIPSISRNKIKDFPSSLPANGGNADTVRGFTADANRPHTLAILDENGKIPLSMVYNHRHNVNEVDGLQNVLDTYLGRINQEMNNFKTLMQQKNDETVNTVKRELDRIKFEENVVNDYAGYYKMPNGLMIQWGYVTVERWLGWIPYNKKYPGGPNNWWFVPSIFPPIIQNDTYRANLIAGIGFNPHFTRPPLYIGLNVMGSLSQQTVEHRKKNSSPWYSSDSNATCVRWKSNTAAEVNISANIPLPNACPEINDEHIIFTWVAIGV